jgi:hypothetical protein
VLDVLLVAGFVVLAVNAPQRGGAPEPTPVASSTADEPETTPDATAPNEVEGGEAIEAFELPSGNIWCEMSEDAATCTILEFSYERPEQRDSCDGELGQVVRVTAEAETGFPCVEEDVAKPDDLPVLDYGEASTVGEMTCQASERGAFCRHDPSQAGFSLARAGVNRF